MHSARTRYLSGSSCCIVFCRTLSLYFIIRLCLFNCKLFYIVQTLLGPRYLMSPVFRYARILPWCHLPNFQFLTPALDESTCLPNLMNHDYDNCQDPAEREALYKSHGTGQLLTQSTIVVFWPSWYRPAF